MATFFFTIPDRSAGFMRELPARANRKTGRPVTGCPWHRQRVEHLSPSSPTTISPHQAADFATTYSLLFLVIGDSKNSRLTCNIPEGLQWISRQNR
jgi:hypothetical protein